MLSDTMLDHVVDRLLNCERVERILLLSATAVGATPRLHDMGRGLNKELTSAREAIGAVPLLVVHADLPLLRTKHIDTLLAAAMRYGRAIAPDRHRTGTNAVAITDAEPVAWHFGPGSLALHRAAFPLGCAVIEEMGLLLDCDTIADLTMAESHGFAWRLGSQLGLPLVQ